MPKVKFIPCSVTGYTVILKGRNIGTVERSVRDGLWYYENDRGGYGSMRTRRAAADALVELAQV